MVVPSPFGDHGRLVAVAVAYHDLSQQFGASKVDNRLAGRLVGLESQAVSVNRQNVKVVGRARVVHPLQVVQIVHAPFAARRVQRGGERAGQHLHFRGGRFHHRVHYLQHLHVGRRVDRAKAPFKAQIRLVPYDQIAHFALIASHEFDGVAPERLVVFLRQIKMMGIFRARPLRHITQAGDHG